MFSEVDPDADTHNPTADWAFDGADQRVAIAFPDRGEDPTTLIGNNQFDSGGNRQGTAINLPEAATFVGKFVGQDIDGPLGVLGTWTLQEADDITAAWKKANDNFITVPDGSGITVVNSIITDLPGDTTRIGSGHVIHGAFGAETGP